MSGSISEVAKLRPAARIISTIGEDLIADPYSAIVELVKNSFDADATKVDITFNFSEKNNERHLNIDIEDDGHGMSRDTVLNTWLVPATNDKTKRRVSKIKGRAFQGKKGIGRYAAAILGDELVVKTIDLEGELTELLIDWTKFQQELFLEDVEILVNSEKPVNNHPGTSLYVTADGKKVHQWGRSELALLTRELRKLKSPFISADVDDFKISLAVLNSPFSEYSNEVFEIEAFPIIDLYDYRISGSVSEQGIVEALYENKSERNLPADIINIEVRFEDGEARCGEINFDFRVFDRDPEAISNLINKGLIDPISKLAVEKREARRMLDEVYGVNLYRGTFRIRPYGDGGLDWLDLDKDRIQNFSLKVSNNQVAGFVTIQSEGKSNLKEKSARDGLKKDEFYAGLVTSLKTVLSQLEVRRFEYRLKTGKGRRNGSVTNQIQNLFEYETLTKEISKKLRHLNIQEDKIKDIATIIHKDAEKKSKYVENIQNTIAIYQGQATLGKIMTILLHEGRKPIHYFKQQSQNLSRWLIHYKAKRDWDDNLYDDLLDRLTNFQHHSDFLSRLFLRLDPLAKQNRGSKIEFSVLRAISKAVQVFEVSLQENNIELTVDCDKGIQLYGWEEDLMIVMTNLIENSIYWLQEANRLTKGISIIVIKNETVVIHFRDNGVGIDQASIESGVLFEPGYSKKIGGTGLGLSIAGEATERLGGLITAHHAPEGAYFTIEIKNNG